MLMSLFLFEEEYALFNQNSRTKTVALWRESQLVATLPLSNITTVNWNFPFGGY